VGYFTLSAKEPPLLILVSFLLPPTVSVAIAKNGFVPALEEVPHSLVSAIIVHSVALVDPLEDLGEPDGKRGQATFSILK
jgi:hypothetical protein